MPFPRSGNVNEVEIVTSHEFFKVAFAVCVDAWRLLTSLLDHLRRARALLFHDVTHGVNDDLINREKFPQHVRATKTDADDSETHHVVRFKLDSDHRPLLRTSSLYCFLFGRMRAANTRRGQSDARETGSSQQLASRQRSIIFWFTI